MAAGRVITGFSKPYVAKYVNESGNVSYTDAMQLARGVDVSISANGSVDNIFYADNQAAETAAVGFVDGTLSLTCDGLKDTARNLIMGLTAGTDWTDYNDDQQIPYVGIGFVMRAVEDGVQSYIPVIFTKTMFNVPNENASTQEASINYQPENLTAQIFRDDTVKHTWKKVGKACATEAEAVTKITAFLA